MRIDIISDFTCPWCLIGFERLNKVMAMRPSFKIDINWRPFFLHPDLPDEGADFFPFYTKKFGGEIEAKSHINAVRDAGFAEGLNFNYMAINSVPNTHMAHALHRFANETGKGDLAVQRLFKAYFVDGLDIGDKDVLCQIAQELELDCETFENEITEGTLMELVGRDVASAVQMGIRVIPSMILNKQYIITGVKEPFDLLQIIERAYHEATASATKAKAPAKPMQTSSLA